MQKKIVELNLGQDKIIYPVTTAEAVKYGNSNIKDEIKSINSQLNDMAYEVAGGTATAITLNMPATLKDGYWKKFIASADNNGAATTINGKPFYKVCSTNPPNLKKDRPYEGYYNLTNDCFFLKASATGTTSADKVLAGETFSTEDITDGVGTMPKRGAPAVTLNSGGSYNIQPGYYSGGKIQVNSMATQMANDGVTLTADQIIQGYKGLDKNGNIVNGTATIESLGGLLKRTKTINVSTGTSRLEADFNIVGFTGTLGSYSVNGTRASMDTYKQMQVGGYIFISFNNYYGLAGLTATDARMPYQNALYVNTSYAGTITLWGV